MKGSCSRFSLVIISAKITVPFTIQFRLFLLERAPSDSSIRVEHLSWISQPRALLVGYIVSISTEGDSCEQPTRLCTEGHIES